MFVRTSVVALALLSAGIATGEEVRSVHLQDLQRGQCIEIRTADRYYRVEIVNRSTGESLVSASWDGVTFTAPRTAYVLGSTRGREANTGGLMLVMMHQLRQGMPMELSVGTLDQKNRRITAPIQSITLGSSALAMN